MSIMTVLWRVQQAQMVISIVFWSLTLTGIFYPYIRDRFLNDLLGPENVLLGMMMIFLMVVSSIILFGLFYDRLKFWREHNIVAQERNPFSYGGRIAPTQLIMWNAILNPNDKEAQADANLLLAYNLTDPKVRDSYLEIRRALR